MIANSGRFNHVLPLILTATPFNNFLKLTDLIFDKTGQTHNIALAKLFEVLYHCLSIDFTIEKQTLINALWQDYLQSGLKGYPSFATDEMIARRNEQLKKAKPKAPQRQARHIN